MGCFLSPLGCLVTHTGTGVAVKALMHMLYTCLQVALRKRSEVSETREAYQDCGIKGHTTGTLPCALRFMLQGARDPTEATNMSCLRVPFRCPGAKPHIRRAAGSTSDGADAPQPTILAALEPALCPAGLNHHLAPHAKATAP